MDDCFSKENNYFFNNFCYKNECPENTVPLSTKNNETKNYYKSSLLLEEYLLEKLCICDTSDDKVWINKQYKEQYFQKCLDKCPEGYNPEEIANQCIEKTETITTQIEKVEISTTQIEKKRNS